MSDGCRDSMPDPPVETRGRPPKGYVSVHVQMPPRSKEALDQIAASLRISQGETIAILVDSYQQNIKRTLANLIE